MSRSHPIVLILAVSTYACGGGWHRLEDLSPRALPQRNQVQVWREGEARLLHDVQLEPDTIEGVPYIDAPGCDSCRVHIPLADVDSLRIGNKERGFFRTAGLVLGIGAVWAYLFRGIGGA